MSTDAAIGRVNTVDFFGVLIPGFYLVLNLALVGLASYEPANSTSEWIVIVNAVGELQLNGLVLLILAAYLLGSTARAFPVSHIDWISGWINGRTNLVIAADSKSKEGFPYVDLLKKCFDDLSPPYTFDVSKETLFAKHPIATFNFWKAVISKEYPGMMAGVRAAEARVRMFAGLGWATAVSFVLSLWNLAFVPGWRGPFAVSLLTSFVLWVLFVTLLRPMRTEESRHVFLAFLAIHRKSETE